jgi:hypothetical protein
MTTWGCSRLLSRCHCCHEVFLKSVKQRRYCSDECIRIVNREGSAQRVAAMRAGLTIEQYRAEKRGDKK